MAWQDFRLKSVGCKAVFLFLAFSVSVCLGGFFSPIYAQGIITTIAGSGPVAFPEKLSFKKTQFLKKSKVQIMTVGSGFHDSVNLWKGGDFE